MSETHPLPALESEEIERHLRATPAGAVWLEWAATTVADPSVIAFRAAYASVQRKLKAVEPWSGPAGTGHWEPVDWARLWLLRAALATIPRERWASAVEVLFEGGEIGEQVSVLRTLWALPEPQLFVDVGVGACRTNAVAVFEAVSCENPYPAAHFDELSFNQMVMKAVFLQVALSRVQGLATRNNDDLQRMARDYASERRAASRAVPGDLCMIDPSIGAAR